MGVKMNTEINEDTKFGFCRGCQKWKLRDNLVSTNILIFGEGVDNIEDTIRLRLCKDECHPKYSAIWRLPHHVLSLMIRRMRWKRRETIAERLTNAKIPKVSR